MEVTVETEEGELIPSELEALGEGTFEVTFMGDGERKHIISILFMGEHIPGRFQLRFFRRTLLRIRLCIC